MPGVMDTMRTKSPRKACEKTTRSRRVCEYRRDEEHAGRDRYCKNNEPT